MINYLLVALGGAIGSVLRFGIANAFERRLGDAFPWGTLFVNVSGSFAIGLLSALAMREASLLHPLPARVFAMTGIMGGYTTFSAFSLQTLQLLQQGQLKPALLNIACSVILCLLGVWAGHALGQAIAR